MSTKVTRRSTRGLLIAALPLAIAVGCATGQSQSPGTAQVSVPEDLPQSDFSYESYLSRMDEPRETESAPEPTTVTESEMAAEGDEPATQPEAVPSDTQPVTSLAEASSPQPASHAIYFGFDESEVDAEDRELLEQHAKYLLENPQLSIVISGHADNRGPKDYNQHLSELRAKRVAGVLMDLGVAEDRITIEAQGAEQPAADAQRWQENRRVEIDYDDSYLVMQP